MKYRESEIIWEYRKKKIQQHNLTNRGDENE